MGNGWAGMFLMSGLAWFLIIRWIIVARRRAQRPTPSGLGGTSPGLGAPPTNNPRGGRPSTGGTGRAAGGASVPRLKFMS